MNIDQGLVNGYLRTGSKSSDIVSGNEQQTLNTCRKQLAEKNKES